VEESRPEEEARPLLADGRGGGCSRERERERELTPLIFLVLFAQASLLDLRGDAEVGTRGKEGGHEKGLGLG
jgi:hypothetical protein